MRRPRPRRTARPHPRPGRSLAPQWLAARARARREARRSSPERIVPAIADSRTACTGTVRRPGLPGTQRRSRVRIDHTSHSSPAPLLVRCRAQVPSSPPPVDLLTTSHLLVRPALPGAAASAAIGITAPSGAGSRGQARHAGSLGQSPSPIRSGRLPGQIQASPQPPLSTTARTAPKRSLPAILENS